MISVRHHSPNALNQATKQPSPPAMAPSRRKSGRSAAKSPAPKGSSKATQSPSPEAQDSAHGGSGNDSENCPACTPASKEAMNGSRKENWIECDNCNTWYHWRCAGNGEDVENIAKWCV